MVAPLPGSEAGIQAGQLNSAISVVLSDGLEGGAWVAPLDGASLAAPLLGSEAGIQVGRLNSAISIVLSPDLEGGARVARLDDPLVAPPLGPGAGIQVGLS